MESVDAVDASHTGPLSVTLLGPQRLQPTVGEAVERLGVRGPIAVITAGWQEFEDEDDELVEALGGGSVRGGRVVNLGLYRRANQVFNDDPPFAEALNRRQRRLRDLQRLYRIRLDHAMAAVRDLNQPRRIEKRLLDRGRTGAMEAVRSLDQAHRQRLAEVHTFFERRWHPHTRPAVVAQRDEIARQIEGSEVVAVAGGHVAVLLNRMRLFGIGGLLAGKHLIAWSAGAMVGSTRVVLFHDMPPQGAGTSEVLENGLGLYPDVLPLPHARHRLRLDDPARVSGLARRHAPLVCLAMDEGARVYWTPQQGWVPGCQALAVLQESGAIREVGA